MSTSSSSECNCLYCHYDANYNFDPSYNFDQSYSYNASYNYDASYNYGAAQTPFYPTMGQPLVYYAQVPNRPERNKGSRGGNPNCFVKAFRWYTQERCGVGGGRQTEGLSNSTRVEPDIASFATWLDSKYEEFVRENRMDHNYRLNTTQTLITAADDGTNNDAYCEPCAPPCAKQKYAGLRSPWKRRNSSLNKKDLGDGYETTNKSLEYIMEPKDLHCPASAYYHNITPTSYYSGSHESKKITVKSQSMTSIRSNKEIHSVDEVTTQDEDKLRPPSTVIMPTKDAADEVKMTKTSKEVSSGKSNASKKSICEVSCQCTVTSVVDRQSQYNSSNTSDKTMKLSSNRQSKESPSPAPQTTVPRKQGETKPIADSISGPPVATKQSNIPCCVCNKPLPKHAQLCLNCQCATYFEDDTVCCSRICSTSEPSRQQDDRPVLQELLTSGLASEVETENQRRMTSFIPRDSVELLAVKRTSTMKQSGHVISMSDTAQTSDHSINLGEGAHGYPLFMKIICADKLDEEVKKRNL